MQVRQRDVAALDAKYTKELSDAKKPLTICVGMSILALNGCASPQPALECQKPPPPPAWMMQEPRTYSRRSTDYFDHRDGIATADKMIRGMQDYIKEQCLK
jgi:prophage endopeptidase